jgi:hypothetical protein
MLHWLCRGSGDAPREIELLLQEETQGQYSKFKGKTEYDRDLATDT